MRSRVFVLAAVVTLAGCGLFRSEPAEAAPSVTSSAPCSPTPGTDVRLVPVAEGLRSPVLLTSPPGDERLFVIEQPGRIRILDASAPAPPVFLDLRRKVETGFGEQGLLGLAFHPDYATNGRFFVNYTASGGGATIVAEYRVSPDDPNVAGPEETRLLTVRQPFVNHNGGHLAFGPDGDLWIGLGDGGAGGDPQGHGQDRETLLGSMVTLDVDAPGAEPKTVAVGLRNPWRYSFDRASGDLWIGDVGQNAWEEISRMPAGTSEVLNFGWNTVEGNHCYAPKKDCDPTGMTPPVLEVARTGRCDSITGGHVYRGQCLPDLVGAYFFGDYCDNWIRSLRLHVDGSATDLQEWTDRLGVKVQGLSSFGEDAAGELYVLSHRDGVVYKMVAR